MAIGIVNGNRVNGFDSDQANHIGMAGEMMYKAGSQDSSKELKDIVMEVLAGKVEDVQEHASGSYTETSARVRKNSSCLLEFGHMNWPTLTKSHRRSIAVEKGALFLVLFLAVGLGCSLFQFHCREDDPHELLMDKSKVYMKEGVNYITKEERHCEERKGELNRSRVERKQDSDMKVKVSHEDLANRAPDTEGLDLPSEVRVIQP